MDATLAPTPTQSLRVLIVDDEPLARMRLQALLEAATEPACTVAGEAEDGLAAVAWLQTQACDLVLMDIDMPGLGGLAAAERIGLMALPPSLVFTTAHGEHALRAFDLAATDYLTKPIRRERLAEALKRVAARRALLPADAGRVVTVQDRGRTLRLPVGEVLYLKAEQKYVTLVTAQRQWVLDDSLAELEQRLGPGFLRVHRNAVVAVSAVRALERRANDEDGAEGWAVHLSDAAGGEWLAVSRRQLAAVREALGQG